MEFLKHTLDNGLEIVAECNSEAHSTALGFFVQTGARDESDEIAGVSHFLEHMVFKGTPTRSAEEVNREFDELGAHYNAFTSEENTVYYAAVLPEYQGRVLALLSDIMRPSLRVEDFDTEKKVIVEEIRMYADQPPFGADDQCRANHFGAHPLGRSVLGTVKSIEHLRVEAMREYFCARYSPGNMVLVGVGRIDFDDLVASAERICGGWQPIAADRETTRATAHGGFQNIHRESATLQYVLQMANAPCATDDDRFAAKVLATVLGDDSGSRFYWELVDPGRAEHASLHHYDYQGTGVFFTYMSCEPDQTAGNMRRLAAIQQAVQKEGITPAELAQAKCKINSRIVLGSERPRNRLFAVGGNWLAAQEYRTVSDDLQSIEAVTVDEVRAVLSRYSVTENTTIAIGPLKKLDPPA